MDNYYSSIKKDQLIDSHGVKYYDFLSGLRPNYGLLWIHLLSGHAALIGFSLFTIYMGSSYPAFYPILIPISSCIIGYIVAYIMLFIHEAAHYNLANDRKLNDLLSNIFVGSLLGQHINDYRVIHWGHHRYHGEINDPEHAYFDPLNIAFFVKALFGVRLIKVYLDRKKNQKTLDSTVKVYSKETKLMMMIGLALNVTIVLTSIVLGYFFFAFIWVAAVLIFFPFFASLRPILEHRGEHARADIDYTKVPHGIVNRLLGDGPITSTLGGAGFNRHLLHHIEPKVSYTRLKEFEKYLLDTQFKDEIKRHQTTYWKTFVNLFE